MIDYLRDVVEAEKERPIFPSTYKAVQVAYMMEAAPPSPKSVLHVLQEMVPDDYPEDKVNTSGIDFGGMSTEDQRAECAIIRLIVERTLDGVELDVIHAKFGRNGFFANTQSEAVKKMINHVRPTYTGLAKVAGEDITKRVFCRWEHKQGILSCESIAEKHGKCGYKTISNAFNDAKKVCFSWERDAFRKLSPIFIARGLSFY